MPPRNESCYTTPTLHLGEAPSPNSTSSGTRPQRLIGANPDLADRAATFSNSRLLREQKNRESVVAAAAEEFAKNPPAKDSDRSIDHDWLTTFARVSETRSDPEMQAYFARILAGEIRAPGSFSPVTLDVAAKLTTDVAVLFQTFCNASVSGPFATTVLTEPFGGNPGGNALTPVGLPYEVLTQLQDMRLVQHDLTAYYGVPPAIFVAQFEIAAVRFKATPKDPNNLHPNATVTTQIHVVNFSRAGRELRRIVHMKPNQTMIDKLAEYLRRFDLELERAEPAN